MKNILVILFLLIFVSFCNVNQLKSKGTVVLTGKVKNYNGENAKLYLNISQPGSKDIREPINIDKSGIFKYTFSTYIPLDATLLDKKTFANINFIYHPGDSIHIEFEAEEKPISLLKTVVFSGDGFQANNEITRFQILREQYNLGYGMINQNDTYKMSMDSFVFEMSKAKEKQIALFNKFIIDNSPTQEAKNWSLLHATETYYYFLDDYGFEKGVPLSYYEYNKTILPITMDKMLCWSVLRQRINRYRSTIIKPQIAQTFSKQMKAIEAGTVNGDSIVINFIFDNSKQPLLSQLLIADYYTVQFDGNVINGYQQNKELIKTKLTEPFIFNPLQELYQRQSDFINKPNEFTDAIIKKNENTPIKETLTKIISENKGKVIYLDCWAVWCGPCREAMPASKELMAKFKNKDVSFVYVCIESEEKVWKRLISEFNIDGGQHYLMNKEQSVFFRDILKVQGIPHYFLINKKGQIVEKGNNLHPSDQSTKDKLEKLMNE